MKAFTALLASTCLLVACAQTHSRDLVTSLTPATNALFTSDAPTRSFRFTYEAQLPAPSPESKLEMWIPVPIDTNDQTITDVSFEASGDYVVRDLVEGTGRSMYMTSVGEDLHMSVHFTVTRSATSGGGIASGEEIARSLEADSLIPAMGKVSAVAASLKLEETGTGEGASVDIAQALYQHTFERMRYSKPTNGMWGRGDAEWACDSRFGNCTDFHSYFMGLARSKGVATRFVMGFPIPTRESGITKVGGYHCWAYFYDQAEGWRPVDISEADKHPEKLDFFFGNLDENRVAMIGGRDVLLNPEPATGRLNLFIYPHAEINGEATRELTKSFSIENLD